MQDKEQNPRKAKSRALFWMLFPVGLLVCSVSGWLVMVSIAVDDPGFSVEPDYYKKAARYDDVLAQRAENSRLGYNLKLVSFSPGSPKTAHLVVTLQDSTGAPLPLASVTAEAFPVARAFDVQELTLQSRGGPTFEGSIERPRPGLWEVRVRVETAEGVYTQSLRTELHVSAATTLLSPRREGPPT